MGVKVSWLQCVPIVEGVALNPCPDEDLWAETSNGSPIHVTFCVVGAAEEAGVDGLPANPETA